MKLFFLFPTGISSEKRKYIIDTSHICNAVIIKSLLFDIFTCYKRLSGTFSLICIKTKIKEVPSQPYLIWEFMFLYDTVCQFGEFSC